MVYNCFTNYQSLESNKVEFSGIRLRIGRIGCVFGIDKCCRLNDVDRD